MIGIGTIAAWLASRNPGMTLAHARRLVTAGAIALGVLLAVGGFSLWLYLHDKGVVEADRAQSKAEVTQKAREADERARGASEAVPDKVEQENDKARDAARGSSDPLRDGLDSLRTEARGDRDRAR